MIGVNPAGAVKYLTHLGSAVSWRVPRVGPSYRHDFTGVVVMVAAAIFRPPRAEIELPQGCGNSLWFS